MAELAAMQKIATALGDLGDDEARRRVLRWADRFSPSTRGAGCTTVSFGAATPAPTLRRQDAMLAIDGLNLFEDDPSDSDLQVPARCR